MILVKWNYIKCRISLRKMGSYVMKWCRIGLMTQWLDFQSQNQLIIYKIYKIFKMRLMIIVSSCFRNNKSRNFSLKIIECRIKLMKLSLINNNYYNNSSNNSNKYNSSIINNNNNYINFLNIINSNFQFKSHLILIKKWIIMLEIITILILT